MSPITITATVPVHHDGNGILACLDSLLTQTRLPDEILVIDDGSADGVAARIEAWCLASPVPARVIRHPGNVGASYARNTAIAAARHDWLACLDADVVAHPDWLEQLATAVEHDADLSGVGGRVSEAKPSSSADAWRILHVPQHWGEHPLGSAPFLYAAGCLLNREHLALAGGFEPRLAGQAADVDLGWKLQAHGRRLAYAPQALAQHQRHEGARASIERLWRRVLPHGERASAYRAAGLYQRYLPFVARQAEHLLALDRDNAAPWALLRLSLGALPYMIMRDQEQMLLRGALTAAECRDRCLGLAAFTRAVWARVGLKGDPGAELWPAYDQAAPTIVGEVNEATFAQLGAALPHGDNALWLAYINALSTCLQAALGKGDAPAAGAAVPSRAKALFTLSGKMGDNFARLPVAYKYARETAQKVDLLIDKPSKPMRQLLAQQDWVHDVRIAPDDMIHYGLGGQPYDMFVPPEAYAGYERVYHLGYRPTPIDQHFTVCALRGSGCPVDERGITELQPIALDRAPVQDLLVHLECDNPVMRQHAKDTLLPIFDRLPFAKVYFVGTDLQSDFYDPFRTAKAVFLDSRHGLHELLPYLATSLVFSLDSSIRWLAYCCQREHAVVHIAGKLSFNGAPSSLEKVVQPGDSAGLLGFFMERYGQAVAA